MPMIEQPDRMRIDKWLWAARFFKTRTRAAEEVALHRVQVAGVNVKPAREIRVGDVVRVRRGVTTQEVTVLALSPRRGPAPEAQRLYAESAESIAARAQAATLRQVAPDPAREIAHGRPTKRQRRALDRERGDQWDERWSARFDG